MLLTRVFGRMAGSFILLPFPLFNNRKAAISCQALVGAGGWGDIEIEKELRFWYFAWGPAKTYSRFRVGGWGGVPLEVERSWVGGSKYAKIMPAFVTFSVCCLDLCSYCFFRHLFIMIAETTWKVLKSQHLGICASGEATASHNMTSTPCHLFPHPCSGCHFTGDVIEISH